jgi:hypothetical protein
MAEVYISTYHPLAEITINIAKKMITADNRMRLPYLPPDSFLAHSIAFILPPADRGGRSLVLQLFPSFCFAMISSE